MAADANPSDSKLAFLDLTRETRDEVYPHSTFPLQKFHLEREDTPYNVARLRTRPFCAVPSEQAAYNQFFNTSSNIQEGSPGDEDHSRCKNGLKLLPGKIGIPNCLRLDHQISKEAHRISYTIHSPRVLSSLITHISAFEQSCLNIVTLDMTMRCPQQEAQWMYTICNELLPAAKHIWSLHIHLQVGFCLCWGKDFLNGIPIQQCRTSWMAPVLTLAWLSLQEVRVIISDGSTGNCHSRYHILASHNIAMQLPAKGHHRDRRRVKQAYAYYIRQLLLRIS